MNRRTFMKRSSIGIVLGSHGPESIQPNHKTNDIMNIKRMNSFDVPHKGIRNGLSQLSLAAGKTDYEDKDQVTQLVTLGREVFAILTTHANDENDVSLKALEERLNGASHHDVEEHIRIHVAQVRLEALLEEILQISKAGGDPAAKGAEFYAGFSDFHAKYIQHMADEERETQLLLWQHFTDEELSQHRSEIMKKLKPEMLLLWFKFIIPALSHRERVALLGGFKTMASENFFREAMSVLKKVLPPLESDLLDQEM